MSETRRAVYTLKSGYVEVQWPSSITPEEAIELEEYLALLVNTIKRVAAEPHALLHGNSLGDGT